ncbi:ABC-type glycerol-3-phosphate transport system substrate-binding protein [Kribbella amoyensis]|uniref:ABC-type glycerol-3-phosphate transport system substrate-binding protein n=1 Tax=Kribbella amoyensis TaxID=996641 RepID=A0A561B2M9_9ACTN|nr:ABC transporter substrate-binding protein [Kribbella amoyensis]TWD73119.1 ABC-type glycerol-3-phosphate transport system substrate-binding protein [Kribbella amoyensis]
MTGLDRRGFLKLALGTTAVGLSAAAVAGCGGTGGGAGAGEGGKTTLRYAWWGNNIRQQNYTKALQQFTAANTDIGIEPEFADYTAFQERMTTQIAAREVPEIFWIASPQVMTYAKSKLYRKLDDIPTLKWDDYSEQDLETFKLGGELNTLPFGIFVPVIRYNETVAKADSVTLPAEGAGWTWDSLAELLVAYSKNNPGRRKGVPYTPDHDLTFEAWLRQHGEQLWTEDGQVGFTVDGLGSWLEWWEKLRKAGAALSLSEQEGMGPDWAQVGKKVLVNFGNSNHIIDDAKMFPKEVFRLRAMPADADATSGHKYLYFPRMAIYQRIEDGKVEAAGKVLDYNVNNPEMLKTVRLTMGAPTNPKVAEASKAFATADEKEMLAVVEKDRAAERKPRYEAPPGSSTWRTTMARVCEEIALGRSSVPDGAKKLVDEIAAGIKRAQ